MYNNLELIRFGNS